MAGGKGKSVGGKAGPKEAATKSQKSHSAKAGLQVSPISPSNYLESGNSMIAGPTSISAERGQTHIMSTLAL